jgi:uncharacterized membrane protein
VVSYALEIRQCYEQSFRLTMCLFQERPPWKLIEYIGIEFLPYSAYLFLTLIHLPRLNQSLETTSIDPIQIKTSLSQQ